MIVGRLQGTSLIDLLEVLSSSKPSELEGGPPVFDLRLFYEERPGAQVAVGQLVVRGPDLVSAAWGELEGLDALAALTRQQHGRCRLVRSSPADTTLKLGPRLGPVATLLAEQLAARPTEALHPILEGVLGIEDDIGLEGFEDDISLDGRQGLEDAVSIADLFEVLGTSRQATELVISRGAAPMGWLLLQGGHLLQVRVEGTGGGETAEDRFRGLVSVQPRVDRFALYRRSETVEAQKLGPLSAFAEIARIEAHRAIVPRPGASTPSAAATQGLSPDRISRDPDSISLFESTADTESVSLQLPPIADPSLLVPDPPLRPSSDAQTRELPGRSMLDSDEPTRDEPTREEMEADLFSMPLEPTPVPTASGSASTTQPGATHPPTRPPAPPSGESAIRASGTGAPAAPRESHPPRSSPPVSRQPVPAPARQPAKLIEEDTTDPPTYTPEPGSPPARPANTGPRVVQPGTRTGNTDVSAARRTHAPPSASQREPSPTPRPVLRVRTAPAPDTVDDPQTDRGSTPRAVSAAGATQVAPAPLPARASVEDQELKLAVAQLREELARQGAQLEALGRDSSMSWGMLAIGIQVFTLVLVVALLILALLPVSL